VMSNSIRVNELRQKLEEAYCVGVIESVESIACDEEELLCSSNSLPEAQNMSAASELRSSFLVVAESGKYFLKRVSDWIDEDQLACIEDFINWTGQQRLNLSPALIGTRTGETHISLGEIRYQLFEFVEQKKRQLWMNAELTEEDCSLAGQLLVKFSEATSRYLECRQRAEEGKSFPRPQDWKSSAIRKTKENWNSLVARAGAAGSNLDPAIARLLKAQNLLEEKLEHSLRLALAAEDAITQAGLTCLVHGDFHPGNILFSLDENKRRTARLVDYDHMHREFSAFDLGYALVMFAYSPSVHDGQNGQARRRADIDHGRAQAFIRGALQSLYGTDIGRTETKMVRPDLLQSSDGELIVSYMTVSSFLIADWAEERLRNGPPPFSSIYSGIIADMADLLLGDSLEKTGIFYAQVRNEILG